MKSAAGAAVRATPAASSKNSWAQALTRSPWRFHRKIFDHGSLSPAFLVDGDVAIRRLGAATDTSFADSAFSMSLEGGAGENEVAGTGVEFFRYDECGVMETIGNPDAKRMSVRQSFLWEFQEKEFRIHEAPALQSKDLTNPLCIFSYEDLAKSLEANAAAAKPLRANAVAQTKSQIEGGFKCGKDFYRGEIALCDPVADASGGQDLAWLLRYRVEGPNKRYVATTEYYPRTGSTLPDNLSGL